MKLSAYLNGIQSCIHEWVLFSGFQDEMTNALASMRFEPDKVTKLKDVGKSSNALLKRRKKWSSTRKECTVHVKTSSIWKKQMSNKGRPFSF